MIEMGIGRGLFRGHVCWSTESHPRGSELFAACGIADGFGDSKIRDQSVASPEENVLRLDVTMYQNVGMSFGQCIRNIPENSDGLADGKLSLL